MKQKHLRTAFLACMVFATLCCEQPETRVESTLYQNGNLHEIIISSGRHKKIIEYSEDGYLLMESNYNGDNAEGVFKTYQRGLLSSIENFKNGMLHGEFTTYDIDCCGLLLTHGFSKDGKQDGIWEYYFRGRIRKAVEYRDGGEQRTIFENKKLDPANQDFVGDSIVCICNSNPHLYPGENR